MLKMALLALSLATDGDVRVTLSEVDTLEECQATGAMMTEIFESAGIQLIATACQETALRLTPFDHGVGPDGEVFRYRVTIGKGNAFEIEPMQTDEVCAPQKTKDYEVFCARSSQSPITR